ncbi:hypothetical protein ACOSQ2_012500 [Xanthoceras sorbifolium]
MQPNRVIQLDASKATLSFSDWTLGLIVMKFLEWTPTLAGDFFTKDVDLRHFLLHYTLMAYKDELATKAELKKKLTEEAKSC